MAATGDNIRERVRKPSRGGAASKETQIIARSGKDVYGTRQSDLGHGGGEISPPAASRLASECSSVHPKALSPQPTPGLWSRYQLEGGAGSTWYARISPRMFSAW